MPDSIVTTYYLDSDPHGNFPQTITVPAQIEWVLALNIEKHTYQSESSRLIWLAVWSTMSWTETRIHAAGGYIFDVPQQVIENDGTLPAGRFVFIPHRTDCDCACFELSRFQNAVIVTAKCAGRTWLVYYPACRVPNESSYRSLGRLIAVPKQYVAEVLKDLTGERLVQHRDLDHFLQFTLGVHSSAIAPLIQRIKEQGSPAMNSGHFGLSRAWWAESEIRKIVGVVDQCCRCGGTNAAPAETWEVEDEIKITYYVRRNYKTRLTIRNMRPCVGKLLINPEREPSGKDEVGCTVGLLCEACYKVWREQTTLAASKALTGRHEELECLLEAQQSLRALRKTLRQAKPPSPESSQQVESARRRISTASSRR